MTSDSMISRRRLAALIAGAATLGLSAAPVCAEQLRGTVFTADEHGRSITAIDLGSGAATTSAVPIAPHIVQISADGRRLLATGALAGGHGTHGGAGEEVSVVDLERRGVERVVAVGAAPHGLRISPDGREVWVANVRDGSVSVVDAARLAEVARIPVGRGPIQLFAAPDGRRVYVASEGTRARPDRTVSVIDLAEARVVATVETGTGAHGVVITPDGSRVFVTNIRDDNVAEIDTATHAVIRRIAVGRGPNGITYRPPVGPPA